ncbi:nitrogenase stabilizing/protective protein NifW [Xanthomonas citri pv. citri]
MADGILAKLNGASSAEEFFSLLGVDYDAKIVNVARLHILRRMGQYLAGEDFTDAEDDVVVERCRAVLERAYADFVASTPIDQRVFKVLKDAVAPQAKPTQTLVQLGTLK